MTSRIGPSTTAGPRSWTENWPCPSVPTRRHQKVTYRLGRDIGPFVESRALGDFYDCPIHVILDEHVHYEPDLCFIARGRDTDPDSSVFRGAPDLIIEILSPSNRQHHTETKFRHYEQYGVREYWLVDPDEESIQVWRLVDGKYTLLGEFGRGLTVATRVLEGLSLDPAQVA